MTPGPPFRAEHVGSLLRPAELHLARASARAGALSAGELRAVEDRLIERAVAKQEAIGLPVVTDGEYRRDFWHLDFLRQLEGVGLAPIAGVKFHAEDVPPMPTVTGRVRCAGPIMAEDFRFLRSVATAAPKLTIPAPAMLHLRGGRSAISREHYPDLAMFWDDVAAAYRAAIAHIAAAGCTYLQLDDVSFSYLCDPAVRDGLRAERRRPRRTAPHLRGGDQPGARRPARGHDGDHAHVPGQLPEHVARLGRLRGRGGGGDVLDRRRRLLHGMGQRARRRLRAAAPAPARQDGGPGARHHQVGRARAEGHAGAPDRRGRAARSPRPPVPVAPVRLREHAPRQHPHRGRAVAKARARGRGRARGLGHVRPPPWTAATPALYTPLGRRSATGSTRCDEPTEKPRRTRL